VHHRINHRPGFINALRHTFVLLTALYLSTALTAHAQPNPSLMKYSCGPANRLFSTLSPTTHFTGTNAGFDLIDSPSVSGDSCHSDKPFFFSVAVPEGNYHVVVTLGGPQASVTTVRAEGRRLMLEKIPTAPGASVTRTIEVNVRVPEISGDPTHAVKLKAREQGILNWDHKLTLEFNGDNPSVRSISIAPFSKAVPEPTIYLAGDSTVVDQYYEPWAAWGQMLPRFFTPGVVIANHAESGETTRSFVTENRLAKIMSLIQPGDYLFIQFAHNDMKPGAVPIDDYKKLLTDYIAQTRAKQATPVLVTSMNRRTFDADGKITNSFAGYPDAMREVAAAQHVALIDLNAMSKTLFETLGPEASMKAFMHYPANAYPNQPEAINDDTHFNSYGAYELARCIVHGIREANLPITKFLAPDVPDFDPAHPDSLTDFHLPPTPILLKTDPTKIGQT
jgi:lysophospholipase L1-like esterase